MAMKAKRRTRLGAGGWLGLLVGAAAAAFHLAYGPAERPAAAQEEPAPKSFAPTERIDVEQAVDFPYDI